MVATKARLDGVDKVISAIDQLIQQLASEGKSEQDQKDSCLAWGPRPGARSNSGGSALGKPSRGL